MEVENTLLIVWEAIFNIFGQIIKRMFRHPGVLAPSRGSDVGAKVSLCGIRDEIMWNFRSAHPSSRRTVSCEDWVILSWSTLMSTSNPHFDRKNYNSSLLLLKWN